MNTQIISKWNSYVSTQDTVLCLGDVTLINHREDALYEKRPDFVELIKSLNGRIILVPGNHDDKRMFPFYESCGWHVVKSQVPGERKKLYAFVVDDMMFCHDYHAPAFVDADIKVVVHGHAHGTRQHVELDPRTYIDVGVDCWNFTPVEVANILDEQRAKLIEEHVNSLVQSR